MNFEKYDKLIWRINGTIIFFTCLVALVVGLFASYKLVTELTGRRTVHDLVNVNQETKKEEFLRLGYFKPLKGTEFYFVSLSSEQKYENSYYSKESYANSRNFLIFNAKSKDSHWVWPSNSFMSLEETFIFNQLEDNNQQKTIGVVFEYVASDSNKDKQLDRNDEKSIQYYDFVNRKSIAVTDKIDRNIGVQQNSASEVLFFYSRNNKSYFKSLILTTQSLTEEKEINLALEL